MIGFNLKRKSGEDKSNYPITLTKDAQTFIPNIYGDADFPSDSIVRFTQKGNFRWRDESFSPFFYQTVMKDGFSVTRADINVDDLGKLLETARYFNKWRVFTTADDDPRWVTLYAGDGERPLYRIKGTNSDAFNNARYSDFKTPYGFFSDRYTFGVEVFSYDPKLVVSFINSNSLIPVPYDNVSASQMDTLRQLGEFHRVMRTGDAFDLVMRRLRRRLDVYTDCGDHKQAAEALRKMARTEELRVEWTDDMLDRATEFDECPMKREMKEYLEDSREMNDDNRDFIEERLCWNVFSPFSTIFVEKADEALKFIYPMKDTFKIKDEDIDDDEFKPVTDLSEKG